MLTLSHYATLLVVGAALLGAGNQAHAMSSQKEVFTKKHFGTTHDGQAVDEYTLSTPGMTAKFLSYGATLTELDVPDKKGKLGTVVLGYDNISGYEFGGTYFGAIIGRVGNRIAHGQFSIDNQSYAVPINNGPNHLHGGFKGYDKRIWKAETEVTSDGPSIRFMLTDPDGTEGYPGTVNITVIYTLTGTNALKIQYYATTDKPTPINLTNHSYFNLKDGGLSDVLGHMVRINADTYTPVDATLIPTGEIAPVKGTPFDFTSSKPIGQDLKATGGDPAGYDHNFVLRSQDGSLAKAVDVYEPESGRRMEVWTTEPGVQFYTSNFLNGSATGPGGVSYKQYHAFCFETQHYPDAVNKDSFPSVVVRPGQVYRQVTEYRFFVGR